MKTRIGYQAPSISDSCFLIAVAYTTYFIKGLFIQLRMEHDVSVYQNKQFHE